MNITKRQFSIYMIFAFGLAWILQVIASIFANQENQMVFTAILVVTMFIPFLATFIARIPLRGMGWVPKIKGNIKYIAFSMWAPAILSVIGGVLFFAFFPHTFDSTFETLRTMMGETVVEQMEERGITIPIYLLITSIQAITIAPFINMFVALGEEVGWRGVMCQYLKKNLGTNRGRIVSGILWGMWHWPVMILAGYEYGKDYIGAPFLGPIVFCILGIVMSILLDFIYEKSKTIWMPSLMHGAINAFTIFAYLLKPDYQNMIIFGPMYIGIISMIPILLVIIVISIKVSNKK